MSSDTVGFYKDEKEENNFDFLLNVNFKQLRHIVKAMNFSEISLEDGLKDVQIIREFLIANKDFLKESSRCNEDVSIENLVEIDKDELMTLVRSKMDENVQLRQQINSLREINERQLVELENKDMTVEAVKSELSDREKQLKDLYMLIDAKCAEEQCLMADVRQLSDKFEHVYLAVDDYENNHQSRFDSLVAQLDLHKCQMSSTQAELRRLTALNVEQTERLNGQSAELAAVRVELVAATDKLDELNARLREKQSKERFLMDRLLQLSTFLDSVHRLASDYETASQTRLAAADSRISELKCRLGRAETDLLAAREQLALVDELRAELTQRQNLIDVYEQRALTAETGDDSSTEPAEQLAPPAILSPVGGDLEKLRDHEKNVTVLESLAFHYEELKIRYRDKRFRMKRLGLEKDQIKNDYDSLRRMCLDKGWVE